MGLKCLRCGAFLSGVLLSGTYGTFGLKEAVVASGNDSFF